MLSDEERAMDAAGDYVHQRYKPETLGASTAYLSYRDGFIAGAAQARAEERERAEFLRLALAEIAGSKSLTATPTQFYQYLQRLAADKLNADAESEIAPGVFSAAIRARKDGQ